MSNTSIRPFTIEDFEHVLSQFSKDHDLDDDQKSKLSERLKKQTDIFVSTNDKGIDGACILDFSTHVHRGNSLDLSISIENDSFIQQRLDALWMVIHSYILEKDVKHVSIHVDKNHFLKDLLIHKGFHQWFIIHRMKLTRYDHINSSLNYRNYQDEDFLLYFSNLGLAFYDMRKAMDIKPYDVFKGATEDQIREEKESLLKDQQKIYMFFDQDQFIGSSKIDGSEIDDVFVIPDVQGKGYGRKIMEKSIHLALNHQKDILVLGVVDWNQRAKNLYESLGFEITRTDLFYRKLY